MDSAPREAVEKTCPVCASPRLTRVLTLTYHGSVSGRDLRVELMRCGHCGLGFLDPMPSWSFLTEEIYNETYSEYDTGWASRPRSRVGRIVGSCFPHSFHRLIPESPGAALDVGCGNGYWMNKLASLGWRVSGLDISESTVRNLKGLGLDVRAGNVEFCDLEENSYDLVMLSAVLEHLREPRRALENVWRALRPGGRIIVNVPNFDSVEFKMFRQDWSLFAIGHLHYFSPRSLSLLLAETNFAPEVTLVRSFEPNFGWSLARKMGFQGSLSNTVGMLGLPVEVLLNQLSQSGELFCRAGKPEGRPAPR